LEHVFFPAGYVLSKSSVIKFVEIALSNKTDTKLCSKGHGGAEDWEMGKTQ